MNSVQQNRQIVILLRILLASFVFLNVSVNSFAQLSRSMKQIPIGNADYNGFARIDKIFYEMPLGNASNADFFFKFSTDPRQEPRYMGSYWTIPFFDSNVIKTSNNRYVWKSPNHGTYTFNKAKVADKGFKETYILNTTGKWKLNIAKDGLILIQNTSDIKSKYVFKNGKLVSFCAGHGCDSFRISFNGKGFPQSIYNVSKNAMTMEFVYGKDGLLSKIVFPREKKSLFIAYGACNVLASDGITKQGSLLKSVTSITFTDGSKEEYEYSAEPSNKYREYLTRKNESRPIKVPTNKLVQTIVEKTNKGFIEWDATTGLIISDSGGEYAVRNPLFDKYNPEGKESTMLADKKRGSPTQESRISYKKPEYSYAEIWDYNIRNAVKITQDPHTGEQTRTSYIGAPGTASMKIRKIEKKSLQDDNWKMFLSRTYNSNGNILREIDAVGNIQEWVYNDKDLIGLKMNSITYFTRSYQKDGSIVENELFENSRVKRILQGDTKLIIEDLYEEHRTTYTLWDANDIKAIRSISNKPN